MNTNGTLDHCTNCGSKRQEDGIGSTRSNERTDQCTCSKSSMVDREKKKPKVMRMNSIEDLSFSKTNAMVDYKISYEVDFLNESALYPSGDDKSTDFLGRRR